MALFSEPSVDAEAFWRFSLAFYGQTGVAAACLALQDEVNADVNIILFLLFLARRKMRVGVEDIAHFDRTVAGWREEAIKPLRDLRRHLKLDASDKTILREWIKEAELEAERIAQERLVRSVADRQFPSSTTPEDAANANLASLAAYMGGLPQGLVKAILSTLSAGWSAL